MLRTRLRYVPVQEFVANDEQKHISSRRSATSGVSALKKSQRDSGEQLFVRSLAVIDALPLYDVETFDRGRLMPGFFRLQA